MESRVRKVIARYYEEPNEIPNDQGKPWMDYLEDRAKVVSGPDLILKDMVKNKEHLDEPFSISNPYDYDDPSDQPKDQGDSPSFENDICPRNEFGYFMVPPGLFKDQGALNDWYKSKHIDFTQDEDEQQPAISLTRKKAEDNIVPEQLLESFSIHNGDFFDFVSRSKVAATLTEIINKDYHYKNDLKIQRAHRCHAVWYNKNSPQQYEKGLFIFKVTSPGSNNTHTVYLQFLRNEDSNASKYTDYTVNIGCTCQSFLFSGAQYYAVRDGYMYMPAFKPDLVAPKSQDQYTTSISNRYPKGKKNPGRGLNARVCKHILAVFNEIKNTPIEVHYKKYPISAPPSKIINKDVWKNQMKFDFSEQEVKNRLLSPSPKVPAYFNRESVTPAVIDWFKNTWFPRTDEQKIKSLKEFSMYPERVYFILVEEAYLKSKMNQKISQRLIDEGYQMMEKIIQPDNEQEPQIIPENEEYSGKGTGTIDLPGGGGPKNEESEDNTIIKPKRIKPKIETKVKNPSRIKRPTKVKSIL